MLLRAEEGPERAGDEHGRAVDEGAVAAEGFREGLEDVNHRRDAAEEGDERPGVLFEGLQEPLAESEARALYRAVTEPSVSWKSSSSLPPPR